MGEVTTQKLIDKTRNFCLLLEKLVELASFKDERPHGTLSNHRRCGRPFSQESDFTNEGASFQMRDLTVSDRDF